jgi:hypothetical protein
MKEWSDAAWSGARGRHNAASGAGYWGPALRVASGRPERESRDASDAAWSGARGQHNAASGAGYWGPASDAAWSGARGPRD